MQVSARGWRSTRKQAMDALLVHSAEATDGALELALLLALVRHVALRCTAIIARRSRSREHIRQVSAAGGGSNEDARRSGASRDGQPASRQQRRGGQRTCIIVSVFTSFASCCCSPPASRIWRWWSMPSLRPTTVRCCAIFAEDVRPRMTSSNDRPMRMPPTRRVHDVLIKYPFSFCPAPPFMAIIPSGRRPSSDLAVDISREAERVSFIKL